MDMAFQMLGIKREDVYIANIVKCRPPMNRNPEIDECTACIDYLRNQVILVRGKWIEKKNIKYMPTWHPAALLRDENKKIDFVKDLQLVVEEVNNG